jgi:hypothetical protein
MVESIRGVVRGNVVIPEKGAELPEGVAVEIRVIPKASKRAWEPFIGLWVEQPEWDRIVEEIYRARTLKLEPPTV